MTFTKKAAAAAGSLAALSMASQDATAEIVHVDDSPLTVSLGGTLNAGVDWDVDGAFGREFVLAIGSFGSIYLDSNSLITGSNGGPLNGQGFVNTSTTQETDLVNNLPQGFVVGPTLASGYQFAFGEQTYRTILTSNGSSFGGDTENFVNGDNFVGFRFDADGTTLYGWAKIEVGLDPGAGPGPGPADSVPGEVTIAEWAYETTGGAIAVGDTGLDTAAVPEPHSLALMAMGAAGVAAWRSRRKKKQTPAENE